MFKDHTRKEIEVQGWFFGGGFRLVDDGHECE